MTDLAGGGGARRAFVPPGVECFELGPETLLLRSRSHLVPDVSGPAYHRVMRHLLTPASGNTRTGPPAGPAEAVVLEQLTAAGMLGWAPPGDAAAPGGFTFPYVQGVALHD